MYWLIVRLDAAVLDATERLCAAWQRLTGKTNLWLAVQLTNLSIVVYFMWAAVEIWTSEWPTRVALGAFCAVLLYGVTRTILRVPIESYEASAYRRVMNGYRNPRRTRDVFLRVPFLGLSVLLLYPSVVLYSRLGIRPLGFGLVMLTTAILYLLACDPLPPAPGKVREWWKRMINSQLPTPKSQTLPTPKVPKARANRAFRNSE